MHVELVTLATSSSSLASPTHRDEALSPSPAHGIESACVGGVLEVVEV